MVHTIARWQAWWRGEDVLDRFALSASPSCGQGRRTLFPSSRRGKVLILHPTHLPNSKSGGEGRMCSIASLSPPPPPVVRVAEPYSPPPVGERFSSSIPLISQIANLVERGGFEPPKASPTDLQSVPFGRSGTSPTLNLPFLIEYFLLV
jgi:hypothetical protein